MHKNIIILLIRKFIVVFSTFPSAFVPSRGIMLYLNPKAQFMLTRTRALAADEATRYSFQADKNVMVDNGAKRRNCIIWLDDNGN